MSISGVFTAAMKNHFTRGAPLGWNYWQQGYGSSYTMGLEYSFIIELGNRFSITYGAGRNRSVYDGKPERSNNAFISLNWRFLI